MKYITLCLKGYGEKETEVVGREKRETQPSKQNANEFSESLLGFPLVLTHPLRKRLPQ